MEYTIEERCRLLKEHCLMQSGSDPINIAMAIMDKDFIRIHGPEHHILDGAAFLTAFKNAGGDINLPVYLDRLIEEGLRMPGAICGLWGVCGSITSIGAALAIIDSTGPLTTDGSWQGHMAFTSKAIENLAKIGEPRCCKRSAYTSLLTAVDFAKDFYGIDLVKPTVKCRFFPKNEQCLRTKCPYFPK